MVQNNADSFIGVETLIQQFQQKLIHVIQINLLVTGSIKLIINGYMLGLDDSSYLPLLSLTCFNTAAHDVSSLGPLLISL